MCGVILIGKGPSADVLREWSSREWRIASVNESALVLPVDAAIDHLVAFDVESLERSRPLWPRVSTFHVATRLHRRLKLDPAAKLDDIPGFPLHRVLQWPYDDFREATTDFRRWVSGPRLAGYVTSTLALHLLCKLGHRRIWCVGHDGGGREVGQGLVCEIERRDDYDRKAHAMRELSTALAETYGADVRFHPEVFS